MMGLGTDVCTVVSGLELNNANMQTERESKRDRERERERAVEADGPGLGAARSDKNGPSR